MIRTLRAVIGFLRPAERAIYFLSIAARALTGLLDVAGIVLIGVLSAVAAGSLLEEPPTVLGFQIPVAQPQEIVGLVLVVLGVFVLKAIIAVLIIRGQASFIAGVESRNAARLARGVFGGSLIEMQRMSRSELQYAIIDSPVYAFTGLLNNLAVIVGEGFLILVVVATLVAVDPLVAVFTLLYFAVVVLLIQTLIGRSVKRAAQHSVAGTVESVAGIGDLVQAFRELVVLGRRDEFVRRVDDSRRRIASSGATLTFLSGMPRYVVETALMLGVVILVSYLFLTSGLAAGLIVVGVFLTGGVRLMTSLLPLQSALTNVKQNTERALPAVELLRQLAEPPVGPSAAEASTVPSSLLERGTGLEVVLTDVTYRYPGADRDALSGVSLRIEPGSFVAIVGPSGAGKTTLADVVLGLIEADGGDVVIGGAAPPDLLRHAPGVLTYVPQRPGLVEGSIADNIALADAGTVPDAQRITEAVRMSHLDEVVDALPDGVDTSVGTQTTALSGGQIQRVGIARALYPQPRLLVLDEATSALDAGSEARIAEILRGLHGRVTVVVIAHRLSTVQRADVVHVLEGGRVLASGSFAEVRATVPMVAEYVKLMSFDESGGE